MRRLLERQYRSAFRRVQSLQIELAGHVYSAQRRREAEQKLQEAMTRLDRARRELLADRGRGRETAEVGAARSQCQGRAARAQTMQCDAARRRGWQV